MANFEILCSVISSSMNLLFLKSGLLYDKIFSSFLIGCWIPYSKLEKILWYNNVNKMIRPDPHDDVSIIFFCSDIRAKPKFLWVERSLRDEQSTS